MNHIRTDRGHLCFVCNWHWCCSAGTRRKGSTKISLVTMAFVVSIPWRPSSTSTGIDTRGSHRNQTVFLAWPTKTFRTLRPFFPHFWLADSCVSVKKKYKKKERKKKDQPLFERHVILTRSSTRLENLHRLTRSAYGAASQNLASPLTRCSKMTRWRIVCDGPSAFSVLGTADAKIKALPLPLRRTLKLSNILSSTSGLYQNTFLHVFSAAKE